MLPFEALDLKALPQVGGKNASLGEMIGQLGPRGVQVPGGFATTAHAYRLFLAHNDLVEPLRRILSQLDAEDLAALQKAGRQARELVAGGEWPAELAAAISAAYLSLTAAAGKPLAVAVRSSATAEDLPNASFAGQQESFLHIEGEEALLAACRRCYASLFTDRAISCHTRITRWPP
ncbi:MAG: PEP/pyruvate-binding domain-containing protein [Prochlorococcaceae cyanobacterium]